MSNSISGVSTVALARPLFRIKKGETYSFRAIDDESLYLDKLCVNDGKDYAILLVLKATSPTVDNNRYYTMIGLYPPPDYVTDNVLCEYGQEASPTYITSGGLDRRELNWFSPLQLPLLGRLELEPYNCSGAAILLIGSMKYTNVARYCQKGRVLLGDNIQIQSLLGKAYRATYTDNTVGEVDVSKLDLEEVLSIRKFATRLAYKIDVADEGSAVRCYSSLDNETWTKIWEKVNLPTVEEEDYIEVENITARYTKFTLDSNNVGKVATLYQYPFFAWVE